MARTAVKCVNYEYGLVRLCSAPPRLIAPRPLCDCAGGITLSAWLRTTPVCERHNPVNGDRRAPVLNHPSISLFSYVWPSAVTCGGQTHAWVLSGQSKCNFFRIFH